ncbi:unnamed protein product [Clavelina lepadiformis]|uniref:Uncharacterized protein n=1 Tax=Clavelina lepadiformis TaxID=159417 RepID=A0ABP0GD21_CLALP
MSKGYDPILGAMVSAKITSTDTGNVFKLDLYDNGSAPDVRKNDGVYSRYFTEYTSYCYTGLGNELAPISASSSSYGSPAAFSYGYVDKSGTVALNPNATSHVVSSKTSGTTTADVDPFSRIEAAGAFSYYGPTAGEGAADFFPPSRVIDLAVKQVEALDVSQGVQLTFTTPGDDYDTGTADFYMRFVTPGVSNSIAPGAKTQNLFNAAGRKDKT